MNSPSPSIGTSSEVPLLSVVVIGRNEGERLERCLASIHSMASSGSPPEVIYVDSASTDGSPQRALALGARVLEVRPQRPSAALGRNAGWRAAQGEFILFLDGDTELHPHFVEHALQAMQDPGVAVVWGHRRESHPEHSIYNRVLDLDWIYPPGPSSFCGGDALMRRAVLEAVGGFDPALIAGEEPELCRRIRARGHTILHIDVPMTRHDLAITRFAAYWKRALRAGHAYGEMAARFGHTEDPLWRKDARRNVIHGSLILLLLLMLPLGLIWPVLWLPGGIAALLLVSRTWRRCAWKTNDSFTRLLYSLHSHLQQLPILQGQLLYHMHAMQGRGPGLIEYKAGPRDTGPDQRGTQHRGT